jgi:hypothetical protein
MPIWVMECSRDGGKTWRVEQPYRIYKKKESAEKKMEAEAVGSWKYLQFRITEYRPVEG